MTGELIAFFAVTIPSTGFFTIILSLIWTHHRRKMYELQKRGGDVNTQAIRAEFVAIREEMRALRDTTTQYDLSFDSALQQVERRLALIERKQYSNSETATYENVTIGGR